MSLRIGLIARCESSRGLAIQSHNLFLHVPVERVLLVRRQPHALDCEERPEWYPGATHITYDHINHTLPQEIVMEWLEGLDVVFTVETPYDWRFPDWARSMRVKTVIQGNPEFYRHDQDSHILAGNNNYKAHPDAWWWPTPWRLDRLPPGQVVPVPMPDIEPVAYTGNPPRFLHVVGKRAYEDRNGTDIVINALRGIEEPCDFTINGFGWELPEINLLPNVPVNLTVERAGVEDRWGMYRDQSILVLPRRYGGLSLPALEAAVSGLGVLMPSCSPNQVLASGFLAARDDRTINMACGRVNVADVNFRDLSAAINDLIRNPEEVQRMQKNSLAMVPRWSECLPIYMDEFERVCNS